MAWFLGKKRHLALTGDSRCALLAEITRSPSGEALPRVLARTDNPLTSDVAVPRLLAAAGDVQGVVALSLPLAFFETVSITLPAMPDAAVSKALPYHLAKAINAPLDTFVYDWQVTGRQKDRLQVAVYLFPAGIFQKLRREFLRKQAQLAFFEPDVFSVFAFLDHAKSLPPEDATLCALLWQDSVSLAVHEKNRLPLVRVVRERQPQGPFQLQPPEERISPVSAQEEPLILLDDEEENEPAVPPPARDNDSILADFAILSAAAPSSGKAAGKTTASETNAASWPEYLQHVILEIMRTRDYYASVQKGASIRTIVVGGADAFWSDFAAQGKELLGTPLIPLGAPAGGPPSQSLLDTLAIGAGARW